MSKEQESRGEVASEPNLRAALARVEKVQYPTVEALRVVRSEFTYVQESLQRAVAEGDQGGVTAATEHANGVRTALKELAAVDPDRSLASDLRSAFDDYYSAATSATRIMLGSETGDSASAIARMQKTNEAVTALVTKSQEEAIWVTSQISIRWWHSTGVPACQGIFSSASIRNTDPASKRYWCARGIS